MESKILSSAFSAAVWLQESENLVEKLCFSCAKERQVRNICVCTWCLDNELQLHKDQKINPLIMDLDSL